MPKSFPQVKFTIKLPVVLLAEDHRSSLGLFFYSPFKFKLFKPQVSNQMWMQAWNAWLTASEMVPALLLQSPTMATLVSGAQ